MAIQSDPEERRRVNRILVDIQELSGKQKKVLYAILKELGFGPGEIGELVILLDTDEEEGGD